MHIYLMISQCWLPHQSEDPDKLFYPVLEDRFQELFLLRDEMLNQDIEMIDTIDEFSQLLNRLIEH